MLQEQQDGNEQPNDGTQERNEGKGGGGGESQRKGNSGGEGGEQRASGPKQEGDPESDKTNKPPARERDPPNPFKQKGDDNRDEYPD